MGCGEGDDCAEAGAFAGDGMEFEVAVVEAQAFAHAAEAAAAAAQGEFGIAAVAVVDELPAAQRMQLDAAIALCTETLEDTRELSRLLRPPILDDFGLEAALRWLARSIGETAALDIELQVEPLPPLDGDLETLLFRVAQEALNNAARHADARSVLMRVVARGGLLQLQVIDDGRGCDPDAAIRSGGSGLGGMRERLRLYDGQLELRSAPGEGTRLRAVVPLPAG